MSNRKGFTLVELLAVVVILSIILLIAVPSVSRIISKSKDNAYISTAKAYIGAARYKYLLEHNDNNIIVYDVTELKVDKEKSPYNKKIIDGAVVVKKDSKSNIKYYIYLVDEDYNSIVDIVGAGSSYPVLISENDLNTSYINKLTVLKYNELLSSSYDILGLYYFSDTFKEGDSSTYNNYIMFTKKGKKVIELNNEEEKQKARNYKKGSLIFSEKLSKNTNCSYWINLGTTIDNDGTPLIRLFPHYYNYNKNVGYQHNRNSFTGIKKQINGYKHPTTGEYVQPLKNTWNVKDVSILNIKDFNELDPRLLVQAYPSINNKSNYSNTTFWVLDDTNSKCTFESESITDETKCSTITIDLNDKDNILKKSDATVEQWHNYKYVITTTLDDVMDD